MYTVVKDVDVKVYRMWVNADYSCGLMPVCDDNACLLFSVYTCST